MTEPTTPAPKRARRRAEPDASPEPAASAPGGSTTDTAASVPDAAPEAPTVMEARSHEDIDRVAVGSLHVERGGIGEATASSVEVKLGGIGRLDAEDVFVQFGGVGAARADHLSVEFGSVGASAAGELRVQQGIASNVIAREATIDQGLVRTLIAQRVTVRRPSAALVVIAARVDGEVRALLDWRGALALGLGFGVVAAIASALRRDR